MSRQDQRRSLLLALGAFALILIIWQVPALSGILAPFRYFVTTIHELGHGIAALLSGGHFIQYEVYASGAGVATTAGGSRWLVLPAGYVGTALFGAALLYAANRTRRPQIVTGVLGVIFLLLTVFFARGLTAILAGLVTAAILSLLTWKGPRLLNTFLLNMLAMLTGLHAVLDLWGLVSNPGAGVIGPAGHTPNDAYAMAQAAGFIPAVGWALLWTLTALVLLGLAGYTTFWQPFRNGAKEPQSTP